MDNREKNDSYIEKTVPKNKEISNEILWDAYILVLTNDFEKTKIR
jgi:hypothetical protein